MLIKTYQMLRCGIWISIAFTFSMATSLGQIASNVLSEKPPLRIGVDANYSLDMEANALDWRFDNEGGDLFHSMAARGVTDFRVRLWTKESGSHGKTYATNIVRRCLAAGIDPYLVLFLSDDWADLMKQPAPAAWKSLSFEERKAAIEAYSFDAVSHFRNVGLTNHLYEIGNEIDYGICGEYPGKSSKKTPIALQRRIWPRTAELIKASQAGVLKADSEAKFMLHISHWWDAEFCVAFFQFMQDQGVQLDVAGLSYFPSSNIGGSRDLSELGRVVDRLAHAIDRKVVLAETAYPSTREFRGQFSRWKYEVMGYPISEAGQRRWIEDLIAFCNAHQSIQGVYYWSPEWYGEGMWKGFALFDPSGNSKSAWSAFDKENWKNEPPKEPRFFELAEESLFPIPVDEAKVQLMTAVNKLLDQTGGVNVEHIRLLEQTTLNVGHYSVNLKASLQKNLSLMLSDRGRDPSRDSSTLKDSREAASQFSIVLDQLDRGLHRIVVVTRDRDDSSLQGLLQLLESRGFEFDVHYIGADQQIVFGMSDVAVRLK